MHWSLANFMVPGGLHPVKIRDIINDKYEIKAHHSNIWHSSVYNWWSPAWDADPFGGGGFITFVAKDIAISKYVCLEIRSAISSVDPILQAELELLDRLLASNEEAARNFIHAPREKFWIEGPHGKHQCLVYDLHAYTLSALWPVNMVKRLAKDSLEALEYLYSNGMCHASMSQVLFLQRS